MDIKITVQNLHLHHHGATADELAPSFNHLEKLIMATEAQFNAGFAKVDVATTALGTLLRDLIAKQQSGNLTAEQEEAVQNKVLDIATTLEAMAATPTNPVPVPVPEA